VNAGGGVVVYYERKGNSSGKNHEPQYEEDHHRPDGPRGLGRPDFGPDRYRPERQPGGRRRRERGDRPRGARAPRPSAGWPGHRPHPAPVGKHETGTGPEREGASQHGAERHQDGGRRGLDACQHRRRVRGKDARRPWCGLRGMHGMGHAAPCHDVPAGQEHHEEQRPRPGQARGPGGSRARGRHCQDGVYRRPGVLPRGDPGLPGTGRGGRRFKDR